jgi:alcohol dehydrogenase
MQPINGVFMPNTSLLGVGCSKAAGAQLAGLGATKTLIVTDKGLAKLGVADKIKAVLEEAGLKVAIFDGAEPNPTELNVADGVKAYQQNGCDSLLSLGGGSSHDCCKGVGLIVSNGGKISEFALGVDVAKKPLPPFVAVNTTAGTASEVTRFCVITSPEHVKYVICDWKVMPKVSLNDPELMAGMPPGMTAATGMDALTHAIEAYVSKFHNPAADASAIGAIQLITKYLRPAVANGQDMEAREMMAYGQFLAGLAFNSAVLGLVHSMAHSAGGKFNLPHGVCNAICLPIACEWNLIACPERFAAIAAAMGEDITGLTPMEAGAKGVAAMRKLSQDVGIPSGFAELGVKESDLPALAELTMKDGTNFFTPRTPIAKDILQLWQKAFGAPLAAAAAGK